ncbi:hypothetical protein C8Q77DRAFT_1088381 [Trametes polyzona]|nr:hypothetical protein C8Q77DRAFT_1088381 [Trametes polyzona]
MRARLTLLASLASGRASDVVPALAPRIRLLGLGPTVPPQRAGLPPGFPEQRGLYYVVRPQSKQISRSSQVVPPHDVDRPPRRPCGAVWWLVLQVSCITSLVPVFTSSCPLPISHEPSGMIPSLLATRHAVYPSFRASLKLIRLPP